MAYKQKEAFAIWITGLPASGKSTLTRALTDELRGEGVDIAVLESDALRQALTPHPHYDEAERETFYRQMVFIGALLTRHGVPVIFDATANLRRYREPARREIPRFLEIFVDSPLEICMARDPKGIYASGAKGASSSVPGLQSPYEPPEHPDLVVRGDRESSRDAAARVMALLRDKGYLAG